MFGFFKRTSAVPAGLDGTRPVSGTRFVVIDTELTGLDEKHDAILSIGAVRMSGGTICLGETFYRLVNPSRDVPAASIVIHEITPSDVREQPEIGSVMREFVDFARGDVLVGHFPAIDKVFLDRDAERFLGKALGNGVIDTCSIYIWLRNRLPQEACFAGPCPDYRLADLAMSMGIPVAGVHNALQDAFIAAQLFQRFIPLLELAGIREIGDLLRIGEPFSGEAGGRRTGTFFNF